MNVDDSQAKDVQSILSELISNMGQPSLKLSVDSVAGQTIVSLTSEDSRALIGPRGETLHAIEFLVKRIAEKKGFSDEHYSVDVNGFRAKHIIELEQRAKMMAERARSFQYDVELPPMSGYERLIVHATLSSMPDIKTESMGEGKNRRVVIKFVAQ